MNAGVVRHKKGGLMRRLALAMFIALASQTVLGSEDGDLGEAVGNLVNSGYLFELASTGACSGLVAHGHDHREDVKMVLAHIPARLKADASTSLSGQALEDRKKELKVFFQETRKKMVPVGSKDFTCGMMLGTVVNMYANARQRWSQLTGAPMFTFKP